MLYRDVAETLKVAQSIAILLNGVHFAGTLCSDVAEVLTVAALVANTYRKD